MTDVQELLKELRGLRVSVERVERVLEKMIYEDPPPSDSSSISTTIKDDDTVKDRYGKSLNVGDKVKFLTKGKNISKTGVVYKISGNKERVTSRDHSGKSVSRHPANLAVIKSTLE